jgi:hypothetical protein
MGIGQTSLEQFKRLKYLYVMMTRIVRMQQPFSVMLADRNGSGSTGVERPG